MDAWIEPIGYINDEVPDDPVSIHAFVVRRWPPSAAMKQVGLLYDPTGVIRFVHWDDIQGLEPLVVGGEYIVEHVTTQEYEGKASVMFTENTTIERLSPIRNPDILDPLVDPNATPDSSPSLAPVSFHALHPVPNKTIETIGLDNAEFPWAEPDVVTRTEDSPRLTRVDREEAVIQVEYNLQPDEPTSSALGHFEASPYCATASGTYEWEDGTITPSYFVFRRTVSFDSTPQSAANVEEALSSALNTEITITRSEDSPLYRRGRAIASEHDCIGNVELHSTEEGQQIRLWCTRMIPLRVLERIHDSIREHDEYITTVVDTTRGTRIDLTLHNSKD